jgi:hypothetical protein
MMPQYIPYSRDRASGQKERNSEPKSTTAETVAEQDGYVVSFKASNCADNKLIVKNTSSGKTAAIAGLSGCSFDPKKNAVIIFPQNEYVGVYNGPTNASEEIASVDLPNYSSSPVLASCDTGRLLDQPMKTKIPDDTTPDAESFGLTWPVVFSVTAHSAESKSVICQTMGASLMTYSLIRLIKKLATLA